MSPLWFKAKKYGYGWYPSTWQGWAVLGIWAVIFTATLLGINDYNWQPRSFLAFLSTVVLIYISYKKGEPARWRWGDTNRKSQTRK